MSEKTAQVELAYPMTIGGRDYQPDDVVDLPYDTNHDGPTALQLVRDGRARWHGEDPTPKPVTSEVDAGPKTTTKSRRSTASASAGQEG